MYDTTTRLTRKYAAQQRAAQCVQPRKRAAAVTARAKIAAATKVKKHPFRRRVAWIDALQSYKVHVKEHGVKFESYSAWKAGLKAWKNRIEGRAC